MKTAKFLITIFALTFLFQSCSNDEDNNIDVINTFVGSWSLSSSYFLTSAFSVSENTGDSYNVNTTLTSEDDCFQTTLITFNPDYTVIISSNKTIDLDVNYDNGLDEIFHDIDCIEEENEEIYSWKARSDGSYVFVDIFNENSEQVYSAFLEPSGYLAFGPNPTDISYLQMEINGETYNVSNIMMTSYIKEF